MAAGLPIDDNTRKQLLDTGEVRVVDAQGIPLVLMTVDARQELHRLVYDDLDEQVIMQLGADQVADPDDWGAPDMDVYDTMK